MDFLRLNQTAWKAAGTKGIVMILDLGLENEKLYDGCRVRGRRPRLHLETSPIDAGPIVEANLRKILAEVPADDGGELVLTGRMPAWIYLLAYEVARDSFDRVSQYDGRRKIPIKSRP